MVIIKRKHDSMNKSAIKLGDWEEEEEPRRSKRRRRKGREARRRRL